uniref:NAD(P)H dehydrogenase subunit 48 n=1 Tax=Cypripedium formosanum TaxID=53042 RepID=A0A0F7GY47_9ASPA
MASTQLIFPNALPTIPSPLSSPPPHYPFTSQLGPLPHSKRPNLLTHAKKKNPWLDPFDDGAAPEMEYGSLFTDGKQAEDPRPPDDPENPYGFLKFPQGYNVELTMLASKVRGDVRRCCCIVSGGVYENLLFFPTIQLIKDRYPGVQVDILTSPRGKQTYEINKNVRWANVYDPDDYFPEPAEYIDMIGVLKNRYYDLMVSTKLAGLGHAAFMFMSSARDKVSYVWPDVNAVGAGLLLTETFIPPSSNLSEGGYNMYHEMLEWLGRPARNIPREPVPPLKVSISKKLREYVEGKYKKAGLEKGKYVVIHGIESDSKASMQSRGDSDSLLPIQVCAEITKEMRDVKPLFVIPHEKEREEVEETVGGEASIIFITTPGQLAALINDSAGVISTNTAALQIANALEKQSIALFSSEGKGRLFVPNAEDKRCVIIPSKNGKLAEIDVETVKNATKVFERSTVFA